LNLYLTWANNIDDLNWNQYQVYFSSISKIKFNNKFVCLTDGIDSKYISKIEEYGCEIITEPRKNKKIFTNRWYSFWKYLSKSDCDKVIITDSRDVLFQHDPFSYCPEFAVGVCCEGFEHQSSSFNMIDQMNLQKNQMEDLENYTDWCVVNGGVCISYRKNIIDFCFLMWSNCLGRPFCTDQAVLNFIYNNLKSTGKMYLFDPRKDSFCLTGEAEKEFLLPYDVQMIDGLIENQKKDRFCVFHQWDRTKFSNQILKRFIK